MNSTDGQYQGTISPLDAMGPALGRTRLMLFEPFDIKKWFLLGFVIFIAQLGSGDFGSGWHGINDRDGSRWVRHGQPSPELENVAQWVIDHLGLILLAGVAIFIVFNAVAIILQYLGSRGHFMFIECVAENKAEVRAPWHHSARPAWTFFLWRLAVFFLLFWTAVLLFALPTLGILREISAGTFDFPSGLLAYIPSLLIYAPLLLLVGIADLLVKDFVTPVMYLTRLDLFAALERTLRLWKGHLGSLLLYFLLRVVVAILGGTIAVMVACFTCCIGALPVIHQTLTSPIHIFVRSWTLAILEGFGPEYRSISSTGSSEASEISAGG